MEFRDAKTMIKAGGNPYNDGTRTRKITLWVVIGHIVFVLVPLVSFWIAGLCSSCSPIREEKPQELVVQVGLVSDQPLGNTQEPAPEVKEPPAEIPLPPVEEPLPPPPPIEQPKPPKIEPPPPVEVKPKPQPKPQPKPVEVKPKPQPKPQPKPVEVKPKPQPKPQPKPPKKSSFLRPDQINVNRSSDAELKKQRAEAERRKRRQEMERQIQAQRDYQRRLAEYNAAQQRAAAQRQQALAGIRRNVTSVRGVVDAGLQGVQAQQYINDLKRVIDPLFIQPSDSLLKGAKPSVNVKLTISPAGRLISAAIVSRSGNGAMDESVEIWIGKVRNTQLPKPSQVRTNISVTVTLRCI